MDKISTPAADPWRNTWMAVILVLLVSLAWTWLRQAGGEPAPAEKRPSQSATVPAGGVRKASSFQYLPPGNPEPNPMAVFASVPDADLRSMRYLLSLQAHGAFEKARAAASNEYENSGMFQREQTLLGLEKRFPEAFEALRKENEGKTIRNTLIQASRNPNPNEPIFSPEEWSQLISMHEQDLREMDLAKELAEAESEEQRAWALERQALKEKKDRIPIP